MVLLLKKMHRYVYIGIVLLFFVLLYPFVFVFSRKPFNYSGLNWVRNIFAHLTSVFSGFFHSIEYEQPVDWSKPYLVCANHFSILDIASMIIVTKNDFSFIGKHDLLDNPVTGVFFRTIDIPINRESKISAFRAFKRAEDYLKEGKSIVIFPEGGISNDFPPYLHPFKNGTFRLAIEQNVPVLPVTILTNGKLFWDDGGKTGSRPGVSRIFVHKPVDVEGLGIADTDTLKDRIFNIINDKLNESRS